MKQRTPTRRSPAYLAALGDAAKVCRRIELEHIARARDADVWASSQAVAAAECRRAIEALKTTKEKRK